jgi:hypothetical protein
LPVPASCECHDRDDRAFFTSSGGRLTERNANISITYLRGFLSNSDVLLNLTGERASFG